MRTACTETISIEDADISSIQRHSSIAFIVLRTVLNAHLCQMCPCTMFIQCTSSFALTVGAHSLPHRCAFCRLAFFLLLTGVSPVMQYGKIGIIHTYYSLTKLSYTWTFMMRKAEKSLRQQHSEERVHAKNCSANPYTDKAWVYRCARSLIGRSPYTPPQTCR